MWWNGYVILGFVVQRLKTGKTVCRLVECPRNLLGRVHPGTEGILYWHVIIMATKLDNHSTIIVINREWKYHSDCLTNGVRGGLSNKHCTCGWDRVTVLEDPNFGVTEDLIAKLLGIIKQWDQFGAKVCVNVCGHSCYPWSHHFGSATLTLSGVKLRFHPFTSMRTDLHVPSVVSTLQ